MNELWKNILAELEMDPEIRGATFKAWFLDSKLLSFENNQAVSLRNDDKHHGLETIHTKRACCLVLTLWNRLNASAEDF